MKQHIRTGIKLAGLKPSRIALRETKHIHLTLPNGAKVTASGSPRDKDTAARRLAADIRSAMGGGR